MSRGLNLVENYIEEKLLHLHTQTVGMIKKVNGDDTWDVQPLIQTKELDDDGGEDLPLLLDVPGLFQRVKIDGAKVIIKPDLDIYSVTNPEAIINGENVETDAELRERYAASLSTGGASTLEALRASILRVAQVKTVLIEENDTLSELNGVPGKSFSALVYGGNDIDIAQAIYKTKPAGIQSYGSVQVTIADSLGNDHLIGFERAEEVPVYANITLTTNEFFPIEGLDKVRTNIIKYIGGLDEDETVYNGLALGEDVIYTKLISAVHAVGGIEDVTVQLGTVADPTGTTNIAVSNRQVAVTDFGKVIVQ
ncbi:hypothetical protein [Exiguobacterium antarcticum]|uniref:hypothetical protein n=1 Tax=Exiguobacterium antarcticum TaxID=132920 RepID=UPI000689AF78|nr:hypothetical protein [Exiguobacterium antarcticum]